MEPDNPLLDQYILRQSAVRTPKVCFIPTASGDAEGYIQGFEHAFGSHGCIPSHLALSRPPSADLEDYVLDKHIVYVGGGNTELLLTTWRETGLDCILRKAWEQGIVLAGLSAGSICWYEQGVSCDDTDRAEAITGLGLIPGSHSPHYDAEPAYRHGFHELLSTGLIGEGVGVDDGVGIHYAGGQIHQVISSRPSTRAYRVESVNGGIRETEMIPAYLGSESQFTRKMEG